MDDRPPAALARLWTRLAARRGETAVVCAGDVLTFGDLDAMSRGYAGRLVSQGFSPGDRVAVFAETAPDVIAALLGHLRSGILHVPINTRYRAEEARHILEDSGATAVLVRNGESGAAVVDEILASSPSIPLRRLEIGDVVKAGPLDEDASKSVLRADGDPAVVVYTSGTTGKSKGAILSGRALAENTLAVTDLWRFHPRDRVVLALPLFHVHGLCLGVLGALLQGATILLLPRFDAAGVVKAFAEDGATVFMGVPTMYARLLEHLRADPGAGRILARGRLFTSGSAPLPADQFAAFREMTGHAILERYGMSETLFTLSNPYEGERQPGTVGLPVPGCAIRVVDESGQDAPPGAVGELWVKSNGMMKAYWGRQAETGSAFRGEWFVTGDMVRVASDGYVTILGRKSADFIKSGGFKISAREIEDVVRRHPRVRDAAVVGAADPIWGERIVAAVTLKDGAPRPSEEDLLGEIAALCLEALADYKRPREVRIFEELPRNVMGKVQKHRLAELLRKT
ncbi:MAG TPA: AMP-binding protein [Thermoanaerobaculia bacterium]|nr:AMP-binding protein [Thermoanaerobaculia bacterium]